VATKKAEEKAAAATKKAEEAAAVATKKAEEKAAAHAAAEHAKREAKEARERAMVRREDAAQRAKEEAKAKKIEDARLMREMVRGQASPRWRKAAAVAPEGKERDQEVAQSEHLAGGQTLETSRFGYAVRWMSSFAPTRNPTRSLSQILFSRAEQVEYELASGVIRCRHGSWRGMPYQDVELQLHEDGTLTGKHNPCGKSSEVKGHWKKSGDISYSDESEYAQVGRLEFELKVKVWVKGKRLIKGTVSATSPCVDPGTRNRVNLRGCIADAGVITVIAYDGCKLG